VSADGVCRNARSREAAIASGAKWFPYNKGGEKRKWFGNDEFVVNWADDGEQLQTRKHPSGDRIWAHNFNLDFIFRPSISWSDITTKGLSARLFPDGFIFDATGLSAFNRTDKDWLNRDEDEVDKYIQDPMAGYVCTGSFFYDFLKGLKSLHTHRPFADHDKEIPILLITGGEDAVSDFGKGIRNLEQLLMDSGVQNVETKIYPGARHEVLKELNKEEVMNDVLSWIYQQLEK
jgi:alpha-beta hydrolase superfamily lysophospholipase